MPLRGGTKFSTRSVKAIRPTLSLLLMALKASRAASSAATSRFCCCWVPNSWLPRAIDQQHHGQLALLDVAFDEGMAHAGGDVPVDGANVVAGLIFADFLEGHAAALEDAAIFAAEQVLDGPASPELQDGESVGRLRGAAWHHLNAWPARLRVWRGIYRRHDSEARTGPTVYLGR